MRKWHNKVWTMVLIADLMMSSLQPYAVAAAVTPETAVEVQESQENGDQTVSAQVETATEQESNAEESSTEDKKEESTQADQETDSVEEGAAQDTTQEVVNDAQSTEDKKEEASTTETTNTVEKEDTTAVAQIGETKYETLSEAISNAQRNDTIVLLDDVEVSAKIIVDKNITIVSEADSIKTIRRSSDFKGSLFEVKGGASLRLGQEDGTQAVIVDGGAEWKVQQAVTDLADSNEASTTEETDSTTTENGAEESQVADSETTEAETEESEVAGSETTEMAKASLRSTEVVEVDAEGPTVEGAYNTGIQAEAAMIQLSNGRVYVYKNTVLQNNDNTKSSGGAISNTAGGSGTVEVYGTIKNNSASGANLNGGAIHNNGFVNVYEGAILSGNKAAKNGGAIENFSGGVITIQGGEWKDNQAELGGAIWADGKTTIQGGKYEDNKAQLGGAVYVTPTFESREVAFVDATFKANKAEQGRDVYLEKNYATFRGSVQIDDVFVKSGTTLQVSNRVTGNIGVTYENPDGENIAIASGKSYTLKESDAIAITSNVEIYTTALKDGKIVFVYAPIVIDDQTHDVKADIEDNTTLSITAHAKSKETVSYQWYESDASGENGKAIDGATSQTYTVKKEKAGLFYYYCVMNAEKASETKSEVISVQMKDKNTAEIPTITSQPVGGTYDLQKEATVKVEAQVEDGGVLSYQWYKATNADLTDASLIADATDSTYTMKNTKAGTFYYYCVITNTKEGLKNPVSTAQSDAAVITVQGAAVRYNGVEYSNINDVLDVLGTEDATLEVLTDVTIDKTTTIDSANVTIKGVDGASVTMKLTNNFKAQAFIVNGGTLTLENVKIDGGAVWYGSENEYLGRGVSNAGRRGTAPLITIAGGTVNLEKGSSLQNNFVDWSVSGVHVTSGTLNINGGSIMNNYGGSHGGAVYATSNQSTINMTNGEIRGNQARTSTGGICADTGTVLTISGGKIFDNYTTGRSGGVFINGTLTLSGDAKIYHNYAGGNGGGIFQNDGTVVIKGGTIENNYAGENGGAIASVKGSMQIKGGTIQNNTAASKGNGVYLESVVQFNSDMNLEGVTDDIYSQKTYTLTFDANGMDSPEAQVVHYLGKYELPTLKRNGYKFLGWYTGTEESDDKVEAGSWITLAKNTTLYAQWKLTATDKITMTTKPEGGVFYIEDNKKLQVVASTEKSAEVSYQWYRCDDEEGNGKVALEGETNSTLALPTELGDYYYFCIVSAEDSVDVQSDIVKVQMISKDVAYTPVFTTQPADVEQYVGEKATFESEATTIDNGTITYQWYRSESKEANIETAEKIEGATSATYEVTPTESGVYYYFVVATNTIKNQKQEDTTSTAMSNVVSLVNHNRITVEDVNANDSCMQKSYWDTYRIGTEKSKDGYIDSMTSLYGNWGSNVLSKAFDGNWGTFWETNRSIPKNTVELTFSKEVKLDRLLYATRQDGQKGAGYPTKLTIYSKDANGEYKEVGVAESTQTGGYRMFTLPYTITSKAIKIEFTESTSNSWASAAEFVLLRSENAVLTGTAKISGTAIPGAKLKVTPELTVGTENVDKLSYQWQESTDGVEFTDIAGETGSEYTVKSGDESKYLRAVVTDGSGDFSGTIVSDTYRGLATAKLEGTPAIGETLKPSVEYVDENANYAYQWQRSNDGENFTNISDATEETYQLGNLVSNQYIRVVLKVSVNGIASQTIYSDMIHVDATALMTGAPQVGSTLKASVKGVEDKEDSLTYTWEMSDSEDGEFKEISPTTKTSYKIQEADLNKFIRVKATIKESGEVLTSEAWEIQEAGTFDDLEGNYVYLSDINKNKLLSSSIGYGSLMYDKNTSGGKITLLVDGEKNYFLKGLGAHAPSTLLYDLSDYVKYYHYDRFIAYLGIDSAQGSNGNGVIFKIQTSEDKETWSTPVQTGVLKGNTESLLVDVSLSGAKYLRIVIDGNGNNASDHSVIADAKLANSEYTTDKGEQTLFKTVAQYDKEIKEIKESNSDSSYEDLMKQDDYKKLVYQRTFVNAAGYSLLKAYAADERYKDTLDWFLNDTEALSLYVRGGNPTGSYANFIEVLAKLYTTHSADLQDSEHGSLYKKMMITLGLTHSADVVFWADSSQKSDPVRRYEIYKKLYNEGMLITNIFENLEVEEMRWVMNNNIDDEEIEWLNYYVRTHSSVKNINPEKINSNNFTPGPYYFIRYTFGYNYNLAKYYSQENKQAWQEKYSLTNETANPKDDNFDLNVSYQSGKPKLWIVFEEGAVCGGISKTGANILGAFGVPSAVIGQPGHAAYLQFNYTNTNAGKEGIGTWVIQNNISGWVQSEKGERMLNAWGSTNWDSGYQASYVLLAQAALNDPENYNHSQELVKLADVYSDDPEEQIRLYEEALSIQNINMDAWVGLINAYSKANKGEAGFVELANRVSNALAYYPLPMRDILENLIKPHITSQAGLASLAIDEQNALKKAVNATSKDTAQPDAAKTMANSLLGNKSFQVATFSFDGENAGKIVLNDMYSGGNQILYSLDGGTTWKNAGVTSEVQLTKEEIESMTAENDLLVRLQGTQSYYTIDITKSSTPSNIYNNDRENRITGNVTGLEWRSSEEDDWKDLTSSTVFEGDQTVQVRTKATNTNLASDAISYTFTKDTDTDSRKYIPLSRIEYVGVSSEQVDKDGNATNALDGNINTIWHSAWDGSDTERYITVKFDEALYLTAFEYTPRQAGNGNGRFLSCEVYTSMDGENWSLSASATGWANDAQKRTINFTTPVYAKYVKIVGTKTVGNFASASMLEFFEDTTVESKTVSSIEVKTAPKKTTYLLGDTIDKTGLVVVAHYDDGTSSTVKHKFLQFDKEYFSELGKQKVTVSYTGNPEATATFDVVVTENNKTPDKITVEKLPTKVRYFVGDSLDTEGMLVKAHYPDNTEGYIFKEQYTVLPGKFTEDGKSQTVTIVSKDNEEASDSFTVEVTKEVKAIEISKKPTTMIYQFASAFDATGMKVNVVYVDGTKEELSDSEYIVQSDGFSDTYGTRKVTIAYARKPEVNTTISVTVLAYVTTPQFVFEAVNNDNTVNLSYFTATELGEDGKVVIPSTVTAQERLTLDVVAINGGAFASNSNITSVTIPSTIQKIASAAFKNDTNLKEVYLTDYKNFDHLTIANNAFSGITGGTVYVSSDKLVQELEAKNFEALKNFTIKSITEKVVDIEVVAPTKTDYVLGENADFTGLVVQGTLEDGSTIEMNSDMYNMTAFDRNKAGVQEMIVTVRGKDISKSFTMTVTPVTPVITTQPTGRVYDSSETVEALEVDASTSDTGHLRYQWYSNTENSVEGAKKIEGATSNTYKPELKDQYYFVVVTNNDAANTDGTAVSVTSEIAHIKVGNYEARIGQVGYATLAEAVEAANAGETVTLTKEVTISSTIALNKNITLNGYSVKRASGFTAPLFRVTQGNVVFADITVDGGAVWTGNTNDVLKRGTTNRGVDAKDALVVLASGKLTLKDGAVLQNNSNTSNNYGVAGGAVRVGGGTLSISGGAIKDNYVAPYGGAVLATGGNVIFESGVVSGNHATSSGGAFCIDINVSFTMTSTDEEDSTVIENNLSYGNGGAIWLSNGKATLNGGIIRGNKAQNGGALYLNDNGTFELGDVTISGNSVTNIANGIYYAGSGQVKITGVPTIADTIYLTTGKKITVASDLSSLDSKILVSLQTYTADGAQFATADTEEHAKAAENAFAVSSGSNKFVVSANEKGLYYGIQKEE